MILRLSWFFVFVVLTGCSAANQYGSGAPSWYQNAAYSCIQAYQHNPPALVACMEPINQMYQNMHAPQVVKSQTPVPVTPPVSSSKTPVDWGAVSAALEQSEQDKLYDAQMRFYEANTPGTYQYWLSRPYR